MPEDKDDKVAFMRKLSDFGISLPQYQHTLEQQEILPM